jgi:hypothetical protein
MAEAAIESKAAGADSVDLWLRVSFALYSWEELHAWALFGCSLMLGPRLADVR